MIGSIFKGQSKKAIQDCLKQVEASPKDKRLHLELGNLHGIGDSEQSQKYFELASKIGELPKDLLYDRTFTGG